MRTDTETTQATMQDMHAVETVSCVVLHGVSWETYERLLMDFTDSHAVHFTFDRGNLEIMVLSAKHEKPNRTLALFVEFWALANDLDLQSLGSTTFKRKDIGRGFAPDSCFYIANAARIREHEEIDLSVDPPPDLVIEIDITHPSLSKLPILAVVGVPEIWRYANGAVTILHLEDGHYHPQENSGVLPGVTSQYLTQFLVASATRKRTALLRMVQEWARA